MKSTSSDEYSEYQWMQELQGILEGRLGDLKFTEHIEDKRNREKQGSSYVTISRIVIEEQVLKET